MAASVTHSKVSTVPPTDDPDLVSSDDWNDGHTVSITAADLSAAPNDVNYLVGTASSGLSAEIAVGTSPGGELGGTWDTPTVDATHSGSSHSAIQSAAESTAAGALSSHAGAADPHAGYVLESLYDAKGDIITASGDNTPAKTTVGADDTILMADAAATGGVKWAGPGATPSTQAFGDAAAAGTTDGYERAGHKHAMPADPFLAGVKLLTTFSKQGAVAVTTESDTPPPLRFYNDTGRTLTFSKIRATATTGPAGAAMTIDVNVDGTTIMTGTKVVIADGGNTVAQTTFSTATVADGHYVSVNVDAVGSGTAGSNLTVAIWVTG